MRIGGLQKLTLLDFPEHVACTVFTMGCDFRCPYCHNSSLVIPERMNEDYVISEEEFFKFLDRRQGLLDGVAITGGEPLIHQDIKDFIRRIREKGFLVKLDTNGSFPQILREILDEGLVDYVAIDIKSDPAGYAEVTGLAEPPVDKLRQSIELLMNSGICYEFRTTVIDELHDEHTMEGIGDLIAGADRYFLQRFEDSGELIVEGRYHAPSEDKLMRLLQTVRKKVPAAEIRGGEIKQ
ncbi:MAG: anaerobic ribonucleoside-triphosphate reductase activating protein [Clostridiales bacterium]|nr:anaerobic ribonucleoside-triphosphate reductase activating protein [Clostridiales bacterium]